MELEYNVMGESEESSFITVMGNRDTFGQESERKMEIGQLGYSSDTFSWK